MLLFFSICTVHTVRFCAVIAEYLGIFVRRYSLVGQSSIFTYSLLELRYLRISDRILLSSDITVVIEKEVKVELVVRYNCAVPEKTYITYVNALERID